MYKADPSFLACHKEKGDNTRKNFWQGVDDVKKQHERCVACGAEVAEPIYAVYDSGSSGKKGEEEDVAGFLCESCGRKHKMKPIRQKNPFTKLAGLTFEEKPN